MDHNDSDSETENEMDPNKSTDPYLCTCSHENFPSKSEQRDPEGTDNDAAADQHVSSHYPEPGSSAADTKIPDQTQLTSQDGSFPSDSGGSDLKKPDQSKTNIKTVQDTGPPSKPKKPDEANPNIKTSQNTGQGPPSDPKNPDKTKRSNIKPGEDSAPPSDSGEADPKNPDKTKQTNDPDDGPTNAGETDPNVANAVSRAMQTMITCDPKYEGNITSELSRNYVPNLREDPQIYIPGSDDCYLTMCKACAKSEACKCEDLKTPIDTIECQTEICVGGPTKRTVLVPKPRPKHLEVAKPVLPIKPDQAQKRKCCKISKCLRGSKSDDKPVDETQVDQIQEAIMEELEPETEFEEEFEEMEVDAEEVIVPSDPLICPCRRKVFSPGEGPPIGTSQFDDTAGCQTDISVEPQNLLPEYDGDGAADAVIQTTVTCDPDETDLACAQKLSEYHSVHSLDVNQLSETQMKRSKNTRMPEKCTCCKCPKSSKGQAKEYPVKPCNPVISSDLPNETAIQNRINKCETPAEKQLLTGMTDTMKTLSTELMHLKQMYCELIGGGDQVEQLAIDEDAFDYISEQEKYEYDTLTHDADEFPMAVVITDHFVKKDEYEFATPARPLGDFEERYFGEDHGPHRMMDTDLSVPRQPLNSVPFTAGSVRIKGDAPDAYPMYDSSLKGGFVPPQLAPTRRVDFSIFLEDYEQGLMTDQDLLVKSKKKHTEPTDAPKPQYDTDLGKPPAKLKAVFLKEFAKCICGNSIGAKEGTPGCICGCPTKVCHGSDDELCDGSESEEEYAGENDEGFKITTKKMRAMFDYDLPGHLIRKPKRVKEVQLETTPMYDADLCPERNIPVNVPCTCVDRADPTCECGCNFDSRSLDTDEEKECNLTNDCTQPMFDFDLLPRSKQMADIQTVTGARAMFDIDMEVSDVFVPQKCTCTEASDIACICGCQYDLPSLAGPELDYYTQGTMDCRLNDTCYLDSQIKDFDGRRAMFDYDLPFTVEKNCPPELVPEGGCKCGAEFTLDCTCGCTYLEQKACKCKGDSVPKAMIDCDIGQTFVMAGPEPLIQVHPNQSLNSLGVHSLISSSTSEVIVSISIGIN